MNFKLKMGKSKRQDLSSIKYLFSVHQESPFTYLVNWVPGGSRVRWEVQTYNLGKMKIAKRLCFLVMYIQSYLKLISLSVIQTILLVVTITWCVS